MLIFNSALLVYFRQKKFNKVRELKWLVPVEAKNPADGQYMSSKVKDDEHK
ncbi:hypothetical protein [Paenibacillus riograndensis]|uniref:hypothetical protein n=1 Tax=Paenibacillus riograndensis TaxID=483937 RepID=UPI0002E8FD62|nr:hypothetical protein [Paenibacillus riograndensis]